MFAGLKYGLEMRDQVLSTIFVGGGNKTVVRLQILIPQPKSDATTPLYWSCVQIRQPGLQLRERRTPGSSCCVVQKENDRRPVQKCNGR